MNPVVEAAWIAGASGLIGVAGTATVAILGFRNTRAATDQTITASAAATDKTITAGEANVRAQIEADRSAQRRDRLADAYTLLGMYLSRYADWSQSVQPYWGAPMPPGPLRPEDRWRVETLVTLYGSPEVRRLLDEWIGHARKIDQADDLIRRVDRSTNPSQEVEAQASQELQALRDYKAAMSAADQALRDQMNQELARP